MITTDVERNQAFIVEIFFCCFDIPITENSNQSFQVTVAFKLMRIFSIKLKKLFFHLSIRLYAHTALLKFSVHHFGYLLLIFPR